MQLSKSEVRDGTRIDWDAPIEMNDGVVLRADIFRPIPEGRCPVVLSYGPYAKGLAFQEGYKSAWTRMTAAYPETAQGSIWPTCIVVPPGYRVGITVRGRDYEYDGTDAAVPHASYPMRGVGPFTHTDPQDRPPEIFGGVNTLHFGETMRPYLLLPVIPAS